MPGVQNSAATQVRTVVAHAAAGLLLVLSTACGDAAGASPDPQPVWQSAFDTSGAGSLSGVWGSGPDDVFVVGGTDEGGEVWHFDGDAWAPMDLPAGTNLLAWVHGRGPDDVWSVGIGGSAVHFDGSAWRAVDMGVTADLWGVSALPDGELWVVGGDTRGDGDPVLVRSGDGVSFERVAIDADENPRGASALFKIWAIGDRLIAVGQRGWIIERIGDRWGNRPAGAHADQDFISLWGTARDQIIVVGGRSNARIAEASADGFETHAPSGIGGVNGVFVDDPAFAIIGGVGGFVGRFLPETDEVVREDGPGSADAVHAVWGDGAGRYYAVGGSFFSPHRGFTWVRTVD